jgi:uncharacterized protein YdeI (YjbR/CyaY-like superfamily)
MVTMTTRRRPTPPKLHPREKPETRSFDDQDAWRVWLKANHATSPTVGLRIAKKGATSGSVTYAEALEVALTWGWIDGQKDPLDDEAWIQRFSRRTAKSPWSKINRDKALALIAAKAMAPPGLVEVERAKKDGRWDAAYDSAKTSEVPADLVAALKKNERAAAFFETIDRANRYAILWRIQTAKKTTTRAERIARFVEMLSRHETLHPTKRA